MDTLSEQTRKRLQQQLASEAQNAKLTPAQPTLPQPTGGPDPSSYSMGGPPNLSSLPPSRPDVRMARKLRYEQQQHEKLTGAVSPRMARKIAFEEQRMREDTSASESSTEEEETEDSTTDVVANTTAPLTNAAPQSAWATARPRNNAAQPRLQVGNHPTAVIPAQPARPAPALNTLSDADVKKHKKGVGSGAINTVDRIDYKRPINPANPASTTGFFKAEPAADGPGLGDAASAVGIKSDDLRATSRSVATSVTDEMLGLDVITKTRAANHGGVMGAVSEAAPGQSLIDHYDVEVTDPAALKSYQNYDTEDLKMAKVYKKGKKYYKQKGGTSFTDHDFSNPETQRGMNDLQWEDALTGQVDRHGGNIFIDPKTGKVKAIDHDAAFGSADMASDPDALAYSNAPFSRTSASHNRGLPSLIDVDTAAKFRSLDWAELAKSYKASGLSDAEIKAAKDRYDAIQAHITALSKQGKVVGAKDEKGAPVGYTGWGQETFDAEVANAEHSYLGTAATNLAGAKQEIATNDTGRYRVAKPKKK